MFTVDMRNPLVHMTLWHVIAATGLLTVILLFNSFSPVGRAAMYESIPIFLLGVGFWALVAVSSSVVGGIVTGSLVWILTFTALVSERTITRYYLTVWIVVGVLLLLFNSGMAWWYLTGDLWMSLPLASAPSLRYVSLTVVWMVVVPLIGATRFIDDIKADPRPSRRRRMAERRRKAQSADN